jgi:uncharacterized protein
MTLKNNDRIANELSINVKQVNAAVELLDDGGTVPFISRYRKEATGELDEVAIAAIRDRIIQLRELDKRKEAILASLEKQEVLTPELRKKVEQAEVLSVLEDIYLPYKPKRKTKASIAKEKGLEPLATQIYKQGAFDIDVEANKYVNPEKGVEEIEQALQGARDIIAEWINENAEVRERIRKLFLNQGVVTSKLIKGKEQAGQKFKDYFEWEEPIKKVPSHRMLAMRRGEKEMILSLDISPEEGVANESIERLVVKGSNETTEHIQKAIKDCYKRLLKPSMETEVRLHAKHSADDEAIKVFSENLKNLLLSAPMGEKKVMAIDPGFRSGCKVVCLDEQGAFHKFEAIYPHEPQRQTTKAGQTIKALCERYEIEAIAIGNGTAGRETETFVKNIGLDKKITIVMVNESGASIYSASEVAREEFPDQDLTVRGAVSIGRRLMDPLAELVKIDAKSIGVGQYQHDVDQSSLKKGLDDVVMSCVNTVGVELNTASKELLSYVSGLGSNLAKSIVDFRNENGPFENRKSLSKVPRLGAKAFEQAAGFLRIRNADNPLDSSGVHPERYKVVASMAKDVGCSVKELMTNSDLKSKIKVNDYVTAEVGIPTLQDILSELEKPGRDPREQFEVFSFEEGVNAISDLKTGMSLPGIVTNVTKFGAFVDVGVHQDGLVHISHLSDSFVSDPAKLVTVQQKVDVTVMEVDIARKRIGLSMKSDPFGKEPAQKRKVEPVKKQNKKEELNDFQSKLSLLKGKFRN